MTTLITILNILLLLFIACVLAYVFVLLIKSMRKYLSIKDTKSEQTKLKKTLGAIIKEHRMKNKMTQEFVAESLGVSRQAVSKWETGLSDPSTSNLIALAKLFGVSADELLKSVE